MSDDDDDVQFAFTGADWDRCADVRKPSPPVERDWVPDIKRRILEGEFLNRIAKDYDVNPGRISEIKAGKLYPEISPAT